MFFFKRCATVWSNKPPDWPWFDWFYHLYDTISFLFNFIDSWGPKVVGLIPEIIWAHHSWDTMSFDGKPV